MRISRDDLNGMAGLLNEQLGYGERQFFPAKEKVDGDDFWNTMVLGMVAAENPSQLKAFAAHNLDHRDPLFKNKKAEAIEFINQVGDDQAAYQQVVDHFGEQIRDTLETKAQDPWPAYEQEEDVKGDMVTNIDSLEPKFGKHSAKSHKDEKHKKGDTLKGSYSEQES